MMDCGLLEQGMDIINIREYGDALRSSGYKNIESAGAEPVDNAIQAHAKHVLTIIRDRVPDWGKKSQVYEMAFLDDGDGMSPIWVQGALRFGNGTHRNERGMGRFGVGLPQSSMYACPRVEVYSWQGGVENCHMSYLDIDMVNDGRQTQIPPAMPAEIPEEYAKYLRPGLKLLGQELNFTHSGTLVIWRTCDNVEPRTATALFNRLEFAFGQKYRYFLSKGKCMIGLVHDTKEHLNKVVWPNDPLFLLPNNVILGDPKDPKRLQLKEFEPGSEPLFEPWAMSCYPDGIVPIPIRYFDRVTKQPKEGVVTAKFSVVKEKFYDQLHMDVGNPGNTEMGKYVGRLEGISVIREDREIDFGKFGFFSDKNNPYHRWWGCEISFGRELDDLFKVANNKQHVELIRLEGSDYEEEEFKPVWLQIEKTISDTIAAMVARNKALRKGSRSGTSAVEPAETTVTGVENAEGTTGESDEVRQTKTEEELESSAQQVLAQRGKEDATEEDVERLLLQKVIFVEKEANDATPYLFTFSVDTGMCICTIYTDHVYYENYISKLDEAGKTAFKLLVASFVRAVDEAAPEKRKPYRRLMNDWNYKMNKYIQAYLGLNDE